MSFRQFLQQHEMESSFEEFLKENGKKKEFDDFLNCSHIDGNFKIIAANHGDHGIESVLACIELPKEDVARILKGKKDETFQTMMLTENTQKRMTFSNGEFVIVCEDGNIRTKKNEVTNDNLGVLPHYEITQNETNDDWESLELGLEFDLAD